MFYIAPIPCGGGKSRTVQAFIRDWKAGGFAGGGNVIIMLGTYKEVESYIGGCGLDKADYACFSKKSPYARYGLGRSGAGRARVLFITHEQLRRQVIGAAGFESLTDLHYRGKPRSLRLCDEGLIPAIPVSFKLSALEALVDAVSARNPKLAAMIDSLRLDNDQRKAGHRFLIPVELRDDAFEFVMAAKERMSPDQLKALEGLAYLAGRYAVLRRDNRNKDDVGGLFVVGASAQLPADLAPCIIMDASAHMRGIYQHWANRTGMVKFLPAPPVSYRNLTLHWWNKGANRSTLDDKQKRATVLAVVAATINSKPDEEWLVIHSKEVRDGSIKAEVEEQLHRPNAKFLHWGAHLGSNDHRHIKNVIIIGSWHYGHIGFAAHHAAAVDNLDLPADDDISAHADGEFAHHVYQAACRSNLRNIAEGVAGEAAVYLITTDIGSRRARLEKAFRDCRMIEWSPVGVQPTDKERTFMKVVAALFKDGRSKVTTKELWQACGAKGAYYLKPLWGRELIKVFLQEHGLERDGNSLIKASKKVRGS